MIPDAVWGTVAQSGFNAVLVLILLWKGGAILMKMTEAIDRNTKAVTLAVLAMPFLPKPFHDELIKVEKEVHDAEHSRRQRPA